MKTLPKRLVALGLVLTILMGCISVANAAEDENIILMPVILNDVFEGETVSSLYRTSSNREKFVTFLWQELIVNSVIGTIEEKVVDITADALEENAVYIVNNVDMLLTVFFFSEDYALYVTYTPAGRMNCYYSSMENAASMSKIIMDELAENNNVTEYEQVDIFAVLSMVDQTSDIVKKMIKRKYETE